MDLIVDTTLTSHTAVTPIYLVEARYTGTNSIQINNQLFDDRWKPVDLPENVQLFKQGIIKKIGNLKLLTYEVATAVKFFILADVSLCDNLLISNFETRLIEFELTLTETTKVKEYLT